MAFTVQTNKRRRTSDTAIHISDLPIGLLVDVSAYLSKPSRAMLAVAFTAPSTSWQNKNIKLHQSSSTSKAIVAAQQWDTLDFMDIKKSLANKLSDDDMYAVLQCINAENVLKKLKLAGCINVTGRGLSSLRESVVLEQIDLCLLSRKYEDPESVIHHSMNKVIVLPILDSIISSIGCSLKHILLPYSWKEDDEDGPLHRFANRYNQHLNSLGISCFGCNVAIQSDREEPWFDKDMLHYNTCYGCLKHYCDYCEGDTLLNFCNICKKDYCKECDDSVMPQCLCIGCREEEEKRTKGLPQGYVYAASD